MAAMASLGSYASQIYIMTKLSKFWIKYEACAWMKPYMIKKVLFGCKASSINSNVGQNTKPLKEVNQAVL